MADFVTRQELEQALSDLEQRQAVLIRQLQGGDLFNGGAILAAGPWSSAVPTATTGVQLNVKRDGVFLISCEATAFHPTGGTIQVDVYVDGNNAGSMVLATATPTNQRATLPRASINVALKKGVHYVAYRLVTGSTSAADVGTIEVARAG